MNKCTLILSLVLVCVLSAPFEDFYKWCDEKGIERNKIEIKYVEEYGNGVYAKEDIKEGEKLLFVPKSAMITILNAANHVEFESAVRPYAASVSTVHLLGWYLLFEKSKKSEWSPYLDILPAEFSSTLYWTEEELELLQSSSVRVFTQKKLNSMKNRYKEEVESGLFYEDPDFFNESWIDWPRFKWALTTLWSRTFSVNIDGEGMAGLVPFADLFNTHHPDFINVAHRMTTEGLELYTNKDINQGEQLFVVYGRNPIPNGQYMMDYGLFIENHPNDNTFIHAPEFNEKDFFLQDKRKVLDEAGLLREYFPLNGKVSAEVIGFLRIQNLVQEEVHSYGKALQQQMVSMRNERAAVRQFITHLNKLLDSYSTSIEADEKMLKKKKITERAKLAIKLRMSEKRLIQSSIDELEKYRDNLFPEEAAFTDKKKKKSK